MAETGKVLFREAWLQNNFPDSIRTDAISGVWDFLNAVKTKYHLLFSKLQYFDSSGLFISLVLSLPLLLNCLIIVIMWFSASWDLMIKVQRSKIRSQIREARNSKKSAGNKEQDKGGAEDKKKD
uniref:Uncharacterized protein n=1 Tax=Branchiostoma floridae TaxID=7739 RepID=C3XYA5_BRAFL|eukprot:XP_002610780.1 hypothetical protein BRAFLDRAFT_126317 [Branchiostoma floridae]